MARYLANGMAAQDAAEAEYDPQAALEAVNQYIADDNAAREAARREELKRLVDNRIQELLHAHSWEISEAEAKRRASNEISGHSAYDDET